ncbi:hypothetical protein BC830DRAFT_1115975 [Chytriomyces sp. MP71]|nr:hypothetical protein BC830DRAFT_1115975 [Chytriomyces sp. MP71]
MKHFVAASVRVSPARPKIRWWKFNRNISKFLNGGVRHHHTQNASPTGSRQDTKHHGGSRGYPLNKLTASGSNGGGRLRLGGSRSKRCQEGARDPGSTRIPDCRQLIRAGKKGIRVGAMRIPRLPPGIWTVSVHVASNASFWRKFESAVSIKKVPSPTWLRHLHTTGEPSSSRMRQFFFTDISPKYLPYTDSTSSKCVGRVSWTTRSLCFQVASCGSTIAKRSSQLLDPPICDMDYKLPERKLKS